MYYTVLYFSTVIQFQYKDKRRLRFLKHKWFCGQKGKLEVIPRLMNESEWAEWARNGSQRVYDEDGDPDGFIIRDGKVYH